MSYYNKLPISGAGNAQNTGQYTIDGNGRTKVHAYAAAAATAKTLYIMSFGQYGIQNQALSTAATDVHVMVAEKTLSTGEYGWFYLAGEVDVTTASDAQAAEGYMWYVHTDGTIKCRDAAFDDVKIDEFAVGTQIEATGTEHTMYLTGKTITWT